VLARRDVAVAGLVLALATTACSSLLAAEPTPVPGAAATLTRSINTPIPTPLRTTTASPVASPSPARAASSPGAAPTATLQALSDSDVADLQQRMEQSVAAPGLPGIDGLLLDHVSLSTASGGSVMTGDEAARWLRDHSATGIKVKQVDRGTQAVSLQVQTDGWPSKDPIQQGQVTFSLRRYDTNGRQDETGGGQWKIDVIEAQ
jgi:hypothetical protein